MADERLALRSAVVAALAWGALVGGVAALSDAASHWTLERLRAGELRELLGLYHVLVRGPVILHGLHPRAEPALLAGYYFALTFAGVALWRGLSGRAVARAAAVGAVVVLALTAETLALDDSLDALQHAVAALHGHGAR